MTNKVIRAIQNARGVGYGSCGICGDKWNWKEHHTIQVNGGYGVFPICEECWQTKSDEEIMRATKEMTEKWLIQSPAHYYEETKEQIKMVIPAVEKALKERKCLADKQTIEVKE